MELQSFALAQLLLFTLFSLSWVQAVVQPCLQLKAVAASVAFVVAEEKQKLLADENNRGYTPFAEETLDPDNQTRGDTKEGFYFGR